FLPAAHRTGRGRLMGGEKALADLLVEGLVAREPPFVARVPPEGDHLVGLCDNHDAISPSRCFILRTIGARFGPLAALGAEFYLTHSPSRALPPSHKRSTTRPVT